MSKRYRLILMIISAVLLTGVGFYAEKKQSTTYCRKSCTIFSGLNRQIGKPWVNFSAFFLWGAVTSVLLQLLKNLYIVQKSKFLVVQIVQGVVRVEQLESKKGLIPITAIVLLECESFLYHTRFTELLAIK